MPSSHDRGSAVVNAIQEARNTIAVMPANFITFPGTATPVFDVDKTRLKRQGSDAITLSVPPATVVWDDQSAWPYLEGHTTPGGVDRARAGF